MNRIKLGSVSSWAVGLLPLFLLLAGCTTSTFMRPPLQHLPKERIAHPVNKMHCAELEANLKHEGVHIIKTGDIRKFILSSDQFFYSNSPNMRPYMNRVLDEIAQLLQRYPKISVHVNGYSDDACSEFRRVALTRARATRVANYLWRRHVDARLMVAKGLGDCKPYTTNSSPEGRALNRRVEIVTRKIVG